MTTDPFSMLGLHSSASASDVRSARRELARQYHPDVGGDADAMQRINDAAAAALKALATQGPASDASQSTRSADWDVSTREVPSFTVEALPAETFEALLVATRSLGEVETDDPPYELSVLMWPPLACWCRLNVVPDAGASTVSVTIASAADAARPSIVTVRNAWIGALNELDWSAL